MLSDHEIAEIDDEIAKFPERHNACLDALMIVQRHRGYVSDEALEQVAQYLGMSSTELDGIATFYNLIFRKPVGRFVIRLCDSVCCYIMGYEDIRKIIKEELDIDWGQTTSDQQFTLLPAQCLGACDRAPVMMVNDRTYLNLNCHRVREILSSQKGLSHESASHRYNETKRTRPAHHEGI